MVDLVKIRKKAREQKESELEKAATTASDPSSPPDAEGASSRRRVSDSAAPSKKSEPKKSRKQDSTAKDEDTGPDSEAPPSTSSGQAEGSSAEGAPSGEKDPYTAESREASAATEDGESRLKRFKRTAGVMDERPEEQDEAVEQDTSDLLELITFALAGEQYAMDVHHLVEIIVPRGATKVPNASEEVIGIISLRGSIVTLLDLRSILGHSGRGEETEDTRIVVVQHENERLGFIVDKVLRVVKVDRSSIESHPVVSAAEQNDAVQGVFLSGDTITIYLDLQRVAG